MSKFDENTIKAALTTVFRLVKDEKPVIWTKIEGLNSISCTLFKEAVTHSFEKSGIPLKRLFIFNEDGKTLHLNTSVNPDYRTSPDLPDYVMEAMAFVSKIKREEAAARKASKEAAVEQPTVETPAVPQQPVAISYAGRPVQVEQLTDEELELGIKEYSLSLQLLQQEKAKRNTIKAKKAELLKVFSEMAKDEGFDLEDLIGLIGAV